jgi:hypothetical protein
LRASHGQKTGETAKKNTAYLAIPRSFSWQASLAQLLLRSFSCGPGSGLAGILATVFGVHVFTKSGVQFHVLFGGRAYIVSQFEGLTAKGTPPFGYPFVDCLGCNRLCLRHEHSFTQTENER